MSILKKIKRRISHIIIGVIKNVPFVWAMKIRNVCFKNVLKNMGKNCNICDAVTFYCPENISLGDRVSIHQNSYIGGTGEINIGSCVAIANGATIISENHNFSETNKFIKDQGVTKMPISIEDDVWLGSKVTILGNTRIGKGTVIGAGSVVTKDIPEYSVAYGIPCKVIKNRK